MSKPTFIRIKSKALPVLGRIVKATFLPLAIHANELVRLRMRLQLNRREHRHALVRRIFFGHKAAIATAFAALTLSEEIVYTH